MEAYKSEFIEFMVQSDVLKFGDFLSDGNLSNAAKSMQALKSLISRGV